MGKLGFNPSAASCLAEHRVLSGLPKPTWESCFAVEGTKVWWGILDGVQQQCPRTRLEVSWLDGLRAPFHINPALFGAVCYFRSSFHSSLTPTAAGALAWGQKQLKHLF